MCLRIPIFFRNNADELLFISKLKNSEIFYDSKKLLNTIASSLEIFNVPFKLDIKNDKFNKSIFTEFNSKKLRLKVNNFINYSNQVRDALLELLFINKNIDIEYEIHNDYLKFNSEDEVKYNGVIEFKPFYLTSNFNYEGLSIKNIFDNNFIVIDLIKSGIFNNRNLNANINLKINDITNIDELNNLYLNFGIEEGIFKFSDSNIMWKDDLKISLLDSSLYSNENEIYILGRFILEFKNIDDFYKSFQVKKNYRKKIKEIQIDFNYNIDHQKIKFDKEKIDSNPNENLEKFVDDFNSSGNQIFNKIKFKNFVSKFFSVYAG